MVRPHQVRQTPNGQLKICCVTIQIVVILQNQHVLFVDQNNENYGRPVAGSKTDFRGQQAGVTISSEIVELCDVIATIGKLQHDGSIAVTFGNLFEFYTRISNKVNTFCFMDYKNCLCYESK